MYNTIRRFFMPLAVIGLLLGCSGLKKTRFPQKVDTRSKPIELQEKKVFNIADMGISATNKFLGARLNGFEKANDSTITVVIRPENTPINNSPYYSFKIWSQNPRIVYLRFGYPKENGHRYHPKIKRPKTSWASLDRESVIQLPDSTTAIRLQVDRDTTWVSAQEVASSVDTQNWVANLIEGKESYVRYKSIGKSTLGKNIPVMDIYKGKPDNRDVVVLLTRHHPPEVTGFMAFKVFLATILDDSGLSDSFLKKYRVLAFPILNPDGADLGHWRHNAGGVDLNRDWALYRQPEIRQVVEHINTVSRRDHCKIVLGLDFHSTYEDVFYTNLERENTAIPNFESEWFKSLEQNIPGYKVNEAPGLSTRPVSKGWFLAAHGAVGITYEIGDETPRAQIKMVGKTSAEQMMRILLK